MRGEREILKALEAREQAIAADLAKLRRVKAAEDAKLAQLVTTIADPSIPAMSGPASRVALQFEESIRAMEQAEATHLAKHRKAVRRRKGVELLQERQRDAARRAQKRAALYGR